MTSSGAVWSDFPHEAEAELDGIWICIARESGNVNIANRVVESITERFWMLARYSLIDDGVTMTCVSGCCLHILRGSRRTLA
jgi:hypothetical protein